MKIEKECCTSRRKCRIPTVFIFYLFKIERNKKPRKYLVARQTRERREITGAAAKRMERGSMCWLLLFSFELLRFDLVALSAEGQDEGKTHALRPPRSSFVVAWAAISPHFCVCAESAPQPSTKTGRVPSLDRPIVPQGLSLFCPYLLQCIQLITFQ